MTSTFLSKPQQVALQQALSRTKLLNNDKLTHEHIVSAEQKAYSLVAVMLYRFNLQKIKWSSFLSTAIKTTTNVCQWLANELTRCQHDYKAQPNEGVISEQSAFMNGIFSEELAYIDALLGTETQAN
ncbi:MULTISPECIES: hypothetical protein [Pseudoalteromonas]|uniref:Orphan protein n=1 Tax=Pseudoalteromonas haloplanktis TaxID=228 RepID=A0ABU1BDR8_PSEHA|nr:MULTISPECIES: hypothetical protein [Pseudoalteromonas]MCF6144815.1 hypothetical protein [Pseudoalteromonas mariniglutinosa NCIMB 1770]MDQ9092377.1 hypothetical protein [Pseudoalteromonas haloplanktis]TMN73885.1 hypothetical protein CWB85_02455 [Pseudoalteromonas sp. S1727]BDF95260.1 hypothetical protein KAN5_20980 [Pseudoalteromonas sp. KAN5]